jgi:hypothetical protein
VQDSSSQLLLYCGAEILKRSASSVCATFVSCDLWTLRLLSSSCLLLAHMQALPCEQCVRLSRHPPAKLPDATLSASPAAPAALSLLTVQSEKNQIWHNCFSASWLVPTNRDETKLLKSRLHPLAYYCTDHHQPFSPSAPSHSAPQSFSPSALLPPAPQPVSPSAIQNFSPSVLLPQPLILSALLPPAPQSFSPSALQPLSPVSFVT